MSNYKKNNGKGKKLSLAGIIIALLIYAVTVFVPDVQNQGGYDLNDDFQEVLREALNEEQNENSPILIKREVENEVDEKSADSKRSEEEKLEKKIDQAKEQGLYSDYEDIKAAYDISDLKEHVREAYLLYAKDGWKGLVEGQTPGTKAGGRWGNYDKQLPETDNQGKVITYKEFDVNNKIENKSRDAQRFVVGSNGQVYYTKDHYDTYVEILE